MDIGTPGSPLAGRVNRRTYRSRIACLNCRRRKVRCTVALHGHPCANCRLDRIECITRSRILKRSLISTASAPWVDSDQDEHTIVSGSQTSSGIDPPAEWPSLLPFPHYPYLQVPQRSSLQPADLAFLESQKCLHVPAESGLKALVAHYFLYAHPCFPVINEARFWPMFRQTDGASSSFSLLVFQAMLFVACSYIPLRVAKQCGAESILSLRNSFYRRAKLLYDFGVEDDPLCLSQALALLTYQCNQTDQLSNSRWLALAIQQVRATDAHLYPGSGKYQASDLKRLWWCLILRDRLISLGMRRPIQILPDHFNAAFRDPLQLEDLADEIYASEVYDPPDKVLLCQILTSQCQLAITLTPLLMAVHPMDSSHGLRGGLASESARIEDIKANLSHWKLNDMLQLSPQDSQSHASVRFFKQLTSLYYEHARLTLYHYISLLYYQHQQQQNWPDLMDAVTAISDKVKRFVIDGTAGQLPISVVAYTVSPQILLNLSLRLSGDTARHKRDTHALKIYGELNHLYNLRYDASHVTSWINEILHAFELSIVRFGLRRETVAHSENPMPARSLSDLLERQPELYFQLADILDSSMSSGHLAQDKLRFLLSMTQPTEPSRALGLSDSPEREPMEVSRSNSISCASDGRTLGTGNLTVEATESASLESMAVAMLPGIEDFLTAPFAPLLNTSPTQTGAYSPLEKAQEVCDPLSAVANLVDEGAQHGSDLSWIDPSAIDMLWNDIALFGE